MFTPNTTAWIIHEIGLIDGKLLQANEFKKINGGAKLIADKKKNELEERRVLLIAALRKRNTKDMSTDALPVDGIENEDEIRAA